MGSTIINISLTYFRLPLEAEMVTVVDDNVCELNIHHLEPELYVPGNILFADGNSLKTTNGNKTLLIVGISHTGADSEGAGTDATFRHISGTFLQTSPEEVLILDSGNHCVRSIDRVKNQTAPFAGFCGHTKNSSRDGSYPLFNFPYSVIIDQKSPTQDIIIAEREGKTLRSLNKRTKYVKTFHKGELKFLNMVQEAVSGNIFVTFEHGLAVWNYHTENLNILVGSSSAGLNDECCTVLGASRHSYSGGECCPGGGKG